MKLQSMTGFGKGEAESDNYIMSVEIKTVNHRFKDIRFKMGSILNAQEMKLKKKIEEHFQRGSFDIYVNYKKNTTKQNHLDLDYAKIQVFINKLKAYTDPENVQLSVNPTEFMRSDFIVEDESKEDELVQLLYQAFDIAIEQLTQSRQIEGEKLIETLKKHQDIYEKHYNNVVELRHSYQDSVKEKLLKKFEKFGSDLSVDEPRFMQEVIYYLEKLDIDEEVNRIKIHLDKLSNVLTSNGEVGRQIDFLIQELNRETNTIGSKSANSEISENVVQMKVNLEKIREQALNMQ